MARLRVFPPDAAVVDWLIERQQRYVVGRGEQADCRVADKRVSREHLALDLDSLPWRVMDLGSKNGTRLDGRPVDSANLPDQCWISVGGVPARFERLDPARADRLRREQHHKHQVSQRMLARLSPDLAHDHLLDTTLNDFLALAECPRGGLFLRTEDKARRLVRARTLGENEGSQSVIDQVLMTGMAQVHGDVRREQAMAERESIVAGSIHALICVPLNVGDSTLGALYADSRDPGKQFTALDLELMQRLARQAAFALALVRMREEILAMHQSLPRSLQEAEADVQLMHILERSSRGPDH